MFLKVKSGRGWTLFDGFDEIAFVYHAGDEAVCARMDAYDLRTQDENVAAVDEGNKQNKYFTEIWLHKSGVNKAENSKQIFTNEHAYVLNDQGKTVETI